MRISDAGDYKKIIRERVRQLSRQRRSLTLKKIAATVPMQYTYLSRVLNREDTHLTEDQLHSICQQLEFFPDEIDYLFTLRSRALTNHPGRREFLDRRIEQFRRSREIQAPIQKATSSLGPGEVKFLLSPSAWLVHISLGIPEYRDNPRKLARTLGLSDAKLLEILHDLSEQSLIETEGSPWKITRILSDHVHYSASHPLTRIHQQLLKDFSAQHLQKLSEKERVGFMATFNADPASFEAIQQKFREFISTVEKIAIKAPSRRTYQLIFDLFPWN